MASMGEAQPPVNGDAPVVDMAQVNEVYDLFERGAFDIHPDQPIGVQADPTESLVRGLNHDAVARAVNGRASYRHRIRDSKPGQAARLEAKARAQEIAAEIGAKPKETDKPKRDGCIKGVTAPTHSRWNSATGRAALAAIEDEIDFNEAA